MDGRSSLGPPPAIEQLRGEGKIALFLDFDGTLVELAARPEAILVPDDLGRRLRDLDARLDGRLALVSGRAIPDLEAHLGALPLARAGSHGIARLLADGTALGDSPEPLPQEAVAKLKAFADQSGLLFESKPHGGALHYRSAPGLECAALALAQRIAGDHDLLIKRGKFVIELVRPGADKGRAVRAFMEVPPFAGARPVFVGDDITDEDGFAAAEDFGGFGILIGDRASRARYRLSGVEELGEWLNL